MIQKITATRKVGRTETLVSYSEISPESESKTKDVTSDSENLAEKGTIPSKKNIAFITHEETSHTPGVPEEPEPIPHWATLTIQTCKNNVKWVLSDFTGATTYTKATGGQYTQRGTEKNRAKCMYPAIEKIERGIAENKVTHLIIFVSKAFGNKGNRSTLRMVAKEVSTRKWNTKLQPQTYDGTPRKEGEGPRPAGGKRGRRV